ncbi:MAG: ImmA/IrrE family metallo-endopeptidase [Tissierellia bacterium]|nr:ImmA/IrrE family metallo-endopeptidase [Tissierellia bacterium]
MYEKLMKEYEDKVKIYEMPLAGSLKGLYVDGNIAISTNLSSADKYTVLAEEIGHYLLSAGDIIDQTKMNNRKQEKLARAWAYEKTVPISELIKGYEKRLQSYEEMAEMLGVSLQYLGDVLNYYHGRYGYWQRFDGCLITFKPLRIIK